MEVLLIPIQPDVVKKIPKYHQIPYRHEFHYEYYEELYNPLPIECFTTCFFMILIEFLIGMCGLFFTLKNLLIGSTADECILQSTFYSISACILIMIGVSGCIGAFWYNEKAYNGHSILLLIYIHAVVIAISFMFIFSTIAFVFDSDWNCIKLYDVLLFVTSICGFMFSIIWCLVHATKLKERIGIDSDPYAERDVNVIKWFPTVNNVVCGWYIINIFEIILGSVVLGLRPPHNLNSNTIVYLSLVFLIMIGMSISSCLIIYFGFQSRHWVGYVIHGQAVVCTMAFGFSVTSLTMVRKANLLLNYEFAMTSLSIFLSVAVFSCCGFCYWIFISCYVNPNINKKLKSAPSLMWICTLCCEVGNFWTSMYDRDQNRKDVWKQKNLHAYTQKVKSIFSVMDNYFPNDVTNVIKQYLGEILEVQCREKYLNKMIEGNKVGILELFCSCPARSDHAIMPEESLHLK